MRAFCTVSAPLEVCASSAEQLSPGSRFLALRLLGHQQPKTLYFLVDAKSRVREVYTQTCLHFATQGMLDTELFGLAVLIDGEYMFADPESKLSKYGPKSWRSSHTHGLDANGRPLLELHFRVQFYIDSPFMLKDENSRHNYYLQLKYNTLQRDIPREYAEQSMILLAGLALQADLGDAPTTPTANGTAAESTKTISVAAGGTVDITVTKDTITKRATTISSTMSLPKISKRLSSVNEGVLRLSTYIASSSNSQVKALGTSSNSLKSVVPATLVPTDLKTDYVASANERACKADYFRIEDYLPGTLHTAWCASALRSYHLENRGMSKTDAELHYIQQACQLHEAINAHMFRMRMTKNENGQGNSWFVVYAKGIKIISGIGVDSGGGGGGGVVVEAEQTTKEKEPITFLWPNITKLSFERKKFEIRSGENKITLYAASDEKNKMLLTLCKETHQFSMKIAARLKEVIKREEEENNCIHSCYIYSRSLHLPYKNKNDQRISVISSTSSNTTSGIVSDRVHSEDELEIMINTPPAPIAAPSTESLALAHLLDRPSVSRQASSVGQASLKDLEEQLAAALIVRQTPKQHLISSREESPTEMSNTSAGNSSCSVSVSIPATVSATASQRTTNSSTATDSPNSQHNIGSQCSSTCSTVVVASNTSEIEQPFTSITIHSAENGEMGQRRNSTSSSLELGFSHTAQNSTVSEVESTGCVAHNYMPGSVCDENECASGVYTLAHGATPTETSGVYTMHSSDITGQSSEIAESESQSSHYGIFQPTKSEISDDGVHLLSNRSQLTNSIDCKKFKVLNKRYIKSDDFRLRSDSNISSTSFRGDGSDPTDNKGQRTLLSAEELTNLIVGRGSYPKCKIVATTMNSDCDYVTLPLSMKCDSYIQGHQDNVSSDNHVENLIDDLLPTDPPAPPQRIDSHMASLSNIHMRSPPPYNARHEKTGLCGPPLRSSLPAKPAGLINSTKQRVVEPPPPTLPVPSTPVVKRSLEAAVVVPIAITPPTQVAKASTIAPATIPVAMRRRDPPPYSSSQKPRPASLISVESNASTNNYHQPSQVLSGIGGSMGSLKSEEVPARFITTRPQISILKAHTSLVNDNAKPSYAAPTNYSSAASSNGSVCSHHLSSHISQHSVQNSNYISGSQASLQFSAPTHHQHPYQHHHSNSSTAQTSLSAAAVATNVGVSTIGIPIVPYGLHAAHKSMSSLHQTPAPPPYHEMKPQACVLLPVIKSRTRQFLPPPPPSLPRQPPPPPPNQLSGMYTTSQLARKQLEIYRQQLYSDVDYVLYPIQDPAVSQQEYLDVKQSSLLAAMAHSAPQPPAAHPYLSYAHSTANHSGAWDTCKSHAIYRSTPYLPLALSSHSRYASTQNLSDTYVQLPASATYSPLYSQSVSLCSSTYEPPPPLHPAALAAATASVNSSNLFARSRSDDNILNSLDSLPKMKRLPPPPPPPPYVNRRLKKPMPAPNEKPPPIPSKPISNLSISIPASRCQLPPRRIPTLNSHNANSPLKTTSSGAQWAGERPKPDATNSRGSNSILAQLQASMAANTRQQQQHATCSRPSHVHNNTGPASSATAAPNALDIALLREKSRNLDLPLISALCNDRSLLKQTKVIENPKLAKSSSNFKSTTTANATQNRVTSSNVNGATPPTLPNPNSSSVVATSTSTQQQQFINSKTLAASPATTTSSLGKPRKSTTSISHRHPNDKLPPLPMQLAEANNYVVEPAALKHHKSYNPQT